MKAAETKDAAGFLRFDEFVSSYQMRVITGETRK